MAVVFGGPATDCIDDIDKAVEGIKANWTAISVYVAIELKHKTFRFKLHANLMLF
jgi:hypothetical protein